MAEPLVIAVPKGRILQELEPLFQQVGIYPEQAFFDDGARQLQFACKDANISLIRVRSFDVATFVAFGAAQLGICGSDVLMEFDYDDLYTPLDLNIGHCRLSVAESDFLEDKEELSRVSHIRVATKYPNVTRKYFSERGIQAECIKLNGAMELAPKLGLSQRIVDLVSTGSTLKANNLKEIDIIAKVSSRLIVNRSAFKTRFNDITPIVERFREVISRAG